MIKLLIFFLRVKVFLRKSKSILWSLSGLTIDVGGGSRPNPLADVIIEPYIDNNNHRQGRQFNSLGKFCIVTSAEHLPFRDKTINHITCSHVLEHVNDPQAVLKEFTRVGKRGYLEVPSYESELFFNREDHLWAVRWDPKNQEMLEFFPKPHIMDNALSSLISLYTDYFYLLYFRAFNFFNIDIYWTDSITCRQSGNALMDNTSKPSTHFEDTKFISLSTILLSKLLSVLKSIKFNKISLDDLLSVMICPKCNSEKIHLNIDKSNILCDDCFCAIKIESNIIYANK